MKETVLITGIGMIAQYFSKKLEVVNYGVRFLSHKKSLPIMMLGI